MTDRRSQAVGIALFAMLAVVIGVVVSQSGGSSGTSAEEAESTQDLLASVDQEGFVLGSADAPLTLVEYGDLQCPFCAEAARDVIPPLVEEYVASGDLRIEFKPLAFIGEDSVLAAQAAVAASEQDLGFAFVEAFYADQGSENSGYVTEEFLSGVAGEVPGLDADAVLADASSAEATQALEDAAADAEAAGVDSTPTFVLGPTGEDGETIDASPTDVDAIRTAIDEALAGS